MTIFLFFIVCDVMVQAQDIPYNQEFRVNVISDETQDRPAVGALADGGYIVCWRSYGDNFIYRQNVAKPYVNQFYWHFLLPQKIIFGYPIIGFGTFRLVAQSQDYLFV